MAYEQTSARFSQFLDNIKLKATHIDDARTKYDGVSKKLHDHFYPTTEYDGSTKLLVGSYSKRTNVRPARDVDVYFKLPWSEFKESSSSYNVQSNLLQRIKGILGTKYPNTNMRGDGQVVVVNFDSKHFIEVAPSFQFTQGNLAGKFYIPNTSNGGSWTLADPRSEISEIEKSDKITNGNTRNLIRMIKKWQEYCSVPIKSLVIELRAINFLSGYEHAQRPVMYYDWMVRDYFASLLDKLDASCKMPGLDEKISYGNEWKSKVESAYSRAIKACEFEHKDQHDNAVLEWKKIFGEDYWFLI